MKKIVAIIIAITTIIFIAVIVLNKPEQSTSKESKPTFEVLQTDKPQIVSTKPELLDNNIITATEIIEISFNRSIENIGEFKLRIEPAADYKAELSGDRKTAKIIPVKPYQLGTTYTMFIGTETKFDGVGRWGEEKVYHFRTIRYNGV